MSGIDWDDAFANGRYIAGAAAYPAAWAEAARACRACAQIRADIVYGPDPRARYDLILPEGRAQGLVVFVHGGYWLQFDKSYWSHLAAGPVAHGWAVALPSYPLAPQVSLPKITVQIAQAIAHAAREVAGPIRLVGHSAGGHLVTRMICATSPLAPDLRARLARVVSVSGLHDLRPLLATTMNAELGLTPQTAAQESAVLQAPLAGVPVTVWVGGHERPEFLRQAALLRESWVLRGGDVTLVVAAGRHHFDVIAELTDAQSALTQAVIMA
ncbi:MAG: alpha/beta fold hydrolase [Rhodobacteraceae bacterium]|nr:MAG: alpha/beta fold hydrolase [Paracoccaceae bacterium]